VLTCAFFPRFRCQSAWLPIKLSVLLVVSEGVILGLTPDGCIYQGANSASYSELLSVLHLITIVGKVIVEFKAPTSTLWSYIKTYCPFNN